MFLLLCKHSTGVSIFENGIRNVSQSIYRQTEKKTEIKLVMVDTGNSKPLCHIYM